jgi:tetratricopeptide (TPR) repeat protein
MRSFLVCAAAMAVVGSAQGCNEPAPDLVASTPLRAGDGGFVRPAFDGGLSRVTVDPMDPESLYLSGQELFLAGEFDKAAESFRKSLRLRPTAKAWHALGDALMTLNRFDEAADAFEEAVSLEPTKRLSWLRRAKCLATAGRPKEAAEAYHKAVELKPDDPAALRDEADVLLEAKQDEQAVDRLRKAMALDAAGAAKDLKLIGESEARREKWAEAVEALRASAKAHPDPGIYSELGEALVRTGDLESAKASFLEAGRLDPKDSLAPETVAEIQLRQNDLPGARASFEASLKVKNRSSPHLALGRLDLKEGKKDAAKTQLDKALAASKGDDVVEVREIAAFALEADLPAVADKLLGVLAAEEGNAKDVALLLQLARAKQSLKDPKGLKQICEKVKAALPKDDKTVCPPK